MNKEKKEKIIKKFPNDMELGKYFRKNYKNIEGNTLKYYKLRNKFPNDMDLGEYLRKNI